MSLHAQLKDLTRTVHDEVESQSMMKVLMSPGLTLESYCRTLSHLLTLYGPLEAELTQVRGLTSVLPDLPRRLKFDALTSDISHCGHYKYSPLDEHMVAVDPIRSVAQALGTLYVLEGSTLGAQMIVKRLKDHPFITDINTRFFNGYGSATGEMWRKFTAALNQLDESQHQEAMQAAVRTFAYFRKLGRAELPLAH